MQKRGLKDIPLWLKYAVAIVAILALLWGVYIYLRPNFTATSQSGVFFNGSNTLINSPVSYNQTNLVPEVPPASTSSVMDPNAAFISVVPRGMIKNTINPAVSDYLIQYDVFNTGRTPANQVHITLLFVSDNKVTGTATNAIYSSIAPGMSTNDRDAIANAWIPLMQAGTNNYLQIIVQYNDYAGKPHKFVIELQIQPGNNDPLTSVFVTKDEFEE